MGLTGFETMKKILDYLLNGGDSLELTETTVILAIKRIAGTDSRTVNKYFTDMQQFNMITLLPGGKCMVRYERR